MPETTDLVVLESHQLAVQRAPAVVLEEAKQAAQALTSVLKTKPNPVIINGQQYLEYEDWQTIARFYDVSAKVTASEYVTYGEASGFSARAVAVRNGEEISAAEAMCLDSEERWKDRELFQLKSMAQTRACAKALRNVLAWVVVLGGYGTTPAEEMDGVARQQKQAEKVPPRADGAVQIAAVDVKKGEKNGKPWTRATVTCSDGRSGSTFDGVLIAEAQAARAQGLWLVVTFEQDGKFTNLVNFEAPPKETQPALPVIDTEPVGQPERILTVRAGKTPDGALFWRIQSDRREYVTNLEGVKALAEKLKDEKLPAYIEFQRVNGASGSGYNKITEFGEAVAEPKL